MMFLSHVLKMDTPLYGDKGNYSLDKINEIASGCSSNSTQLTFPAHTGTHIDAPCHFDQSGDSIDQYSAEFWVCENIFIVEFEVDKEEIITLKNLISFIEKIPESSDCLIIKTGFETYRDNNKDYIFHGPGIAPEVGVWLRNNRALKMIGFDFISLSSYAHRELGREAHRAFLSKSYAGLDEDCSGPILIIEDMHLALLNERPTKIIVAPLRYQDSDGSPVTVICD